MYEEGHAQMKLAEEMEALALSENDKTKSTEDNKETAKVPEAKEKVKVKDTKEAQANKIKDELDEIIGKFETSAVISTTTTKEETVKGAGEEVTETIVETDVVLLSKA